MDLNFDLDVVDTVTLANQGVDMPLKTLAGVPIKNKHGKPVSIRLVGTDSEIYRNLMRARMVEGVNNRDASALTEELLVKTQEQAIDTVVACTLGWTNVLDKDGAEIKFTAEAARLLYKQYPAIRDQADRFIADRQNFLLKSAAA